MSRLVSSLKPQKEVEAAPKVQLKGSLGMFDITVNPFDEIRVLNSTKVLEKTVVEKRLLWSADRCGRGAKYVCQ